MFAARPIPHIIDRHAEDAAFLWLLRAAAVEQPHYDLVDLTELDERLLANLDGLLVAGEAGWHAALEQLQMGESGETFVAAWLAAHARDGQRLDRVLHGALADADNRRALISALAWHPLTVTRELLEPMLRAHDAALVAVAVRVLALRRVDPGPQLEQLLQTGDSQLLSAALRACGALRRRDLAPQIRAHYQADQPQVACWAQWAGALLGDPGAVDLLQLHLLADGPFASRALPVVMRALPAAAGAELLRALAANPRTERLAVQGAGMSGDVQWVPGLCLRMNTPALARVAGEALALLTGVDLAYEDLDTDQPPDWQAGPTDDPADESVALDPDEDLAWPEPALVAQWWQRNQQRFPPGARYLRGAAITAGHCRAVLGSGYQRQRQAAALELALLGEPLFETRAPAPQQLCLLGPGR